MADKKISELTEVTTLSDTSLITAVDLTRAAGDENVKIQKSNLQTDLTPTLQEVITADPTATSKMFLNESSSSIEFQKFGGRIGSINHDTFGVYLRSEGFGRNTEYRNGQILVDGFNINIPQKVGSFSVIGGNYDASLNSPLLSNSDTFKSGVYFIVTVAGTVDFGAGNITFGVGDIVANDGIVWFKEVDNNQSTTETATYSATSTTVTTLDLDTFDSIYQILTTNTDIQWSNTPASGESFVKPLEVIGAFSLTFTTSTKVIGTYVDDGTTVNIITVNFANYPTVGLRTTVMITQ